jgi:hypothetical protein
LRGRAPRGLGPAARRRGQGREGRIREAQAREARARGVVSGSATRTATLPRVIAASRGLAAAGRVPARPTRRAGSFSIASSTTRPRAVSTSVRRSSRPVLMLQSILSIVLIPSVFHPGSAFPSALPDRRSRRIASRHPDGRCWPAEGWRAGRGEAPSQNQWRASVAVAAVMAWSSQRSRVVRCSQASILRLPLSPQARRGAA